MNSLDRWISAVLIVADANGMDDRQEIVTWPFDVRARYPRLTVGDVREWQARTTDASSTSLEVWLGDGRKLLPADLSKLVSDHDRLTERSKELESVLDKAREILCDLHRNRVPDGSIDDANAYGVIGAIDTALRRSSKSKQKEQDHE